MLGLSLKRKTGCCVPPLGKCLQWKAFSITPCINWLCFTDTKTGDEYKYIHRGPWPSVCLSLSFKGTVHPKIKNSYFSYFSLPVGLFYSSRLFWCKLSSLEDICHGAVGLSSNIMEVDGTHGFWFSKCQKPKQKKGQNQLSSNVFFFHKTWPGYSRQSTALVVNSLVKEKKTNRFSTDASILGRVVLVTAQDETMNQGSMWFICHYTELHCISELKPLSRLCYRNTPISPKTKYVILDLGVNFPF